MDNNLANIMRRRNIGFAGQEGALIDEQASQGGPTGNVITNESLGYGPQGTYAGRMGGAESYQDRQGNMTTYTPSGVPVTMSADELAGYKQQGQNQRELKKLQDQAMMRELQVKAGLINDEKPSDKLAREKFEWEKGQGNNSALKSTEDEKKSAGYVVRMETALKQMEDVAKTNPDQTTPNPFIQMLGGISETAKNYAQPVARQRIESAQEDALDAALTLATGAAYTKEQLKGLRNSYFPMAGDAPETIADKRARFSDVIKTARLRSGRMEPGANEVIAGSAQTGAGQTQQTGGYEQTATNPRTGERIGKRNGKWEPIR
jgi:hypothetical protein